MSETASTTTLRFTDDSLRPLNGNREADDDGTRHRASGGQAVPWWQRYLPCFWTPMEVVGAFGECAMQRKVKVFDT